MSQIINAAAGTEPSANKMTAKGGKQAEVNTDITVTQLKPVADKNVSETKPVEKPELDNAVVELNEHFQSVNRDLHFSVDEESGHSIIKVVDSETEEVVRQIPAEYVLKLARNLNEDKELSLFSIKV